MTDTPTYTADQLEEGIVNALKAHDTQARIEAARSAYAEWALSEGWNHPDDDDDGWAAALAAADEVAANAKRPPTPMAEGPLARIPEGVMRSHPTGKSQ